MYTTSLITIGFLCGQATYGQPSPAPPSQLPTLAPPATVIVPLPTEPQPMPADPATRPRIAFPPAVLDDSASTGQELRDEPARIEHKAVEPEKIHRASVSEAASISPADQLLQGLIAPPRIDPPVSGEAVSLEQALSTSTSRDQRLQIAKSYWETAIRIAQVHAAQAYRDRLVAIRSPQSAVDQSSLDVAAAGAEVDFRQARLVAVEAQFHLAQVAGIGITHQTAKQRLEHLPLPTDHPLVGGYRTKFQSLFSSREASYNAHRLDTMLPLVREQIRARTVLADAAQEALGQFNAAYADGVVSSTDMLRAHRRLHDQQQRFLTVVLEYNTNIAEYAINAVGSGLSTKKIVSMLIHRSPSSRSVLVPDSGIQRASSAEVAPARRSGLRTVPPGGRIPLRPIPPEEDFSDDQRQSAPPVRPSTVPNQP